MENVILNSLDPLIESISYYSVVLRWPTRIGIMCWLLFSLSLGKWLTLSVSVSSSIKWHLSEKVYEDKWKLCAKWLVSQHPIQYSNVIINTTAIALLSYAL